jgi:hypothetical protein
LGLFELVTVCLFGGECGVNLQMNSSYLRIKRSCHVYCT